MLKINDLYFSFKEKDVLKGIDFEVEKGSICGVLGLNGAGKTTLFRTIFGHYPLQNGVISWNGAKLTKEDISFLETENYFYPFTKGIEHLQLVTMMQTPKSQLLAWNELFELPLDDLIETYSTGMRKKLAFLSCLLQNRPLMILDEPFNGIDLESSERLFIILKKLQASGKTIILSSHILSSLTSICDKIIPIKNGKVSQIYDKTSFATLSTTLRAEIALEIDDKFAALDL